MLKVHSNLDAIRKKRGITQMMLARSTGIAQPTINVFCTAKRVPSLQNALRIANYLGREVGEVWSLEDEGTETAAWGESGYSASAEGVYEYC